ncbi:MAG: S-layer homology domain-containing protein [Bacillota bacterium]|jgi:hypothetical protein
MKRKKLSMLMTVAVLSLLMCLFAAMPAMAAGSYADITAASVQQSKLDISNINLSDSSRSYTITIDKGALSAAESKGKTFRISMDNVTLAFAPEALYTADYKKAVKTGKPVQVKFYVKTKQGIDMGRYFTSGLNNNFMLTTKCTTIKAEILVSGVKAYNMYKFASPVSFIQNYSEDWNNYKGGKSETGVTLAWYDLERKISSGVPQWIRLSTDLDTKNNVAEGSDIYSCGIIVPIVCSDLNNATGGSSGGNQGGGTSSGIPESFWAKYDIEEMQQAGIVPAAVNTSKLNQPIARDEFVAYLVRSLGLQEDLSLAGKFTDVAEGNAYYKEIYTGVKNGLVTGTGSSSFSPAAKITRQEMAAFFTRALSLKGHDFSTDQTKLRQMKDAADIAVWAKSSCAAAVNRGLITGRSAGSYTVFAPTANTTWAEAVVMLNRLRADI